MEIIGTRNYHNLCRNFNPAHLYETPNHVGKYLVSLHPACIITPCSGTPGWTELPGEGLNLGKSEAKFRVVFPQEGGVAPGGPRDPTTGRVQSPLTTPSCPDVGLGIVFCSAPIRSSVIFKLKCYFNANFRCLLPCLY